MKNLHIGAYAMLAGVNASLELKEIVTSDRIDDNYKIAIIESYKKMKKQLSFVVIATSVMICMIALIGGMSFIASGMHGIAFAISIGLISTALLIVTTVYIANHAGKIYTEARKAYRKGMLGLSESEMDIRKPTSDEQECLRYFKRLYIAEWIFMFVSYIPIITVGLMFNTYKVLVILLIIDTIYFMCFRIDSSKTEIHRLSTGYYRIPKKMVCQCCGKTTLFLVHSSDTLFCEHCGNEMRLESWERASYKMHKKTRWLIDRRQV